MNELKIEIIDMEPYCYEFLTEKAIEAVSIKTQYLLHQFNVLTPTGVYVRHCCSVLYLGYTCTKEEVPDVVEILCSKLNHLAERDFIKASLKTRMVVAMADPDDSLITPLNLHDNSIGGERKYVVMSYVAILQEGEEYIKEHMPYLRVAEGGIPFVCSNKVVDYWEDTSTYAISEI